MDGLGTLTATAVMAVVLALAALQGGGFFALALAVTCAGGAVALLRLAHVRARDAARPRPERDRRS